jgi:hypothetical protein
MKKEKHITIRLPLGLYQKLLDKTIEKSKSESKIINLSKIIREILEKNI